MKFRKKSALVEARRSTGTPESNQDIIDWTRNSLTSAYMDIRHQRTGESSPCLSIDTLLGALWIMPGDWVIKKEDGEFYPCKPDLFEAYYELVE